MRVLVWLVMLGCGPTPCERLAEAPERDSCFHAEILTLPTSAVGKVTETASRIQDPVVRNATVLTWARDHRDGVDPTGARALCALLPAEEGRLCERRLFAAHLDR